MSLGEKLRQARLEAGLSQRALCGDVITRNMLSQIEHGTATPSMATLQYLSQQLHKPVSFFLEEQPGPAQTHPWLEAVTLLEQARHLLQAGKAADASRLLSRLAADTCPDWIRRQKSLLLFQLQPEAAGTLAPSLPSLDGELMLRARAAADMGDAQGCITYLQAAQEKTAAWQLLMGRALLAQGQWAQASAHLLEAEAQFPHEAAALLEICYREQADFQKAYFYACRVRSLTGNASAPR